MADREVVIPSDEVASAPSVFVSSVMGGVGSGGEVIVQLYRDMYRTPKRFRVTVRPDGATQQAAEFDESEGEEVAAGGMVRVRVGELVMTPGSALQLAAWLQQAVAGLQGYQRPQPVD